jgi:hypothetical protein
MAKGYFGQNIANFLLWEWQEHCQGLSLNDLANTLNDVKLKEHYEKILQIRGELCERFPNFDTIASDLISQKTAHVKVGLEKSLSHILDEEIPYEWECANSWYRSFLDSLRLGLSVLRDYEFRESSIVAEPLPDRLVDVASGLTEQGAKPDIDYRYIYNLLIRHLFHQRGPDALAVHLRGRIADRDRIYAKRVGGQSLTPHEENVLQAECANGLYAWYLVSFYYGIKDWLPKIEGRQYLKEEVERTAATAERISGILSKPSNLDKLTQYIQSIRSRGYELFDGLLSAGIQDESKELFSFLSEEIADRKSGIKEESARRIEEHDFHPLDAFRAQLGYWASQLDCERTAILILRVLYFYPEVLSIQTIQRLSEADDELVGDVLEIWYRDINYVLERWASKSISRRVDFSFEEGDFRRILVEQLKIHRTALRVKPLRVLDMFANIPLVAMACVFFKPELVHINDLCYRHGEDTWSACCEKVTEPVTGEETLCEALLTELRAARELSWHEIRREVVRRKTADESLFLIETDRALAMTLVKRYLRITGYKEKLLPPLKITERRIDPEGSRVFPEYEDGYFSAIIVDAPYGVGYSEVSCEEGRRLAVAALREARRLSDKDGTVILTLPKELRGDRKWGKTYSARWRGALKEEALGLGFDASPIRVPAYQDSLDLGINAREIVALRLCR